MSEKNCANCRFGYKAIEYYSHGDMKWCCMLETGGEKKRYALGNASFAPRSCIRWKGEERTCRVILTENRHAVCSECGGTMLADWVACPRCGAKVNEVGE